MSKLRLIILGAPGSGKGTISSRIVTEFRLTHLSSGDLLRNAVANQTELGIEANNYINSGQLVPDNLITKFYLYKIAHCGQSGLLLDGFPRSLPQCESLEKNMVKLDRVLNLDVPFKTIVNRLKHRWVHPPSGRVYNLEFNPPKVVMKDDVTGEPLVQRTDDSEEVVLKRLKLYEQQSKPVIDFYKKRDILDTFTGETSDYLWGFIKPHLQELDKAQGSSELATASTKPFAYPTNTKEPVTHTGQLFAPDDYRRVRFSKVNAKIVNKNFAIDLIKEAPIIVCDARVVWSSGGGPLGHPKVYINVDPPEPQDCGYSGRRFIKKKYYDKAKHGECITYEQYLDEMLAEQQKESATA